MARSTYVESFGHTFTPEDLAAHLEAHLSDSYFRQAIEDDFIMIAVAAERMVGFIQCGPIRLPVTDHSPRDRQIRRLYVEADHQRTGIGTALLDAALRHPTMRMTHRIYLDVWEGNEPARAFYERHGFRVVGAHRFVVASGVETDDELIMVRDGDPPG